MHDSNFWVFPLDRRRTLVESIAQALETKKGEAASAFWRCAAKKMLIQLSDVGIAQSSLRRRLEAFFMRSWTIWPTER
ncbi:MULTISPECIES: DUF6074 family protein [unclassified Mesorhizobium]|uniref:DUF6074 family protein n=1 Tax=unclassified Mesorhizobium TaxID=325217 RepID=UPI001FE01630|nr:MULTISPECIES: DUF6074 family protein [unclassified Mesorhizobium]